MDENLELKFPFGDEAVNESSAWPLEQEPTDVLVLWPGSDDEPPTQTEVIAALREQSRESLEVLEDVDPPSPDVQWAVATRLGALEMPVIVWVQPAMPVPPGELGDAAAEACRWVIGFETMLSPSDPISSYATLLRTLVLAFSESPAMIDINSTMVHRRAQLDETYGSGDSEAIEPAADDLWMIHAVHAPQSAESDGKLTDDGKVWLHTHGLSRCGLPELEMLEVPARYASTAAELLNDVAALMFEFPPTAPGETYEVGDGLAITFQPWREMVEMMDESTPGGPADRRENEGENPHAGVRAVICGARKVGGFRQVWSWPREVIERLESDEATIFMTQRATDRQAKLAQERWGDLATAFVSAQKAELIDEDEPRAVFLIKAGYTIDGAAEGARSKEHLWFEANGFGGDFAEAKLINHPVNIASMKQGDRVKIHREDVSDWQVQSVAGSFGPQDVAMLWQTLDALRKAEARS